MVLAKTNCVLLSEFQVPDDERKALIGFHAVTGNDYTSAFFGKGKGKCWKVNKSKEEILRGFQVIGENWQLSGDVLKVMEKFTCKLYGSKKSQVYEARYELF